MMNYIQSAATLLAVINPLICGVILLQVEDGLPKEKMFLCGNKVCSCCVNYFDLICPDREIYSRPLWLVIFAVLAIICSLVFALGIPSG